MIANAYEGSNRGGRAGGSRGDDGPSVAIIGAGGYPGVVGDGQHMLDYLVPYLTDRGWQVTIYQHGTPHAASSPTSSGAGIGDTRIKVARVWSLGRAESAQVSAGLSSVVRLAACPADVALVMSTAVGLWLPFLRIRGIPSVVVLSGGRPRGENSSKLMHAMRSGRAQATAWFADDLIFASPAIQEEWMQSYSRSGEVITPGEGAGGADLPDRWERSCAEYEAALLRAMARKR